MNFPNSYISTFNPKIKPKIFVFSFLIIIIFTFLFSFLLHLLDFQITDNDVIRIFQIKKINSKEFIKTNTIFVGDSSCGNSINHLYFDDISGLKSENLCLTGSWGIAGSLGVIRKAINKNPSIKNIVVIQTLDIWNRPFPNESILQLYPIKESINYLSLSTITDYLFNPKEIWWHIKYLVNDIINNNRTLVTIDLKNDYLRQQENKYSNGKLKVKENSNLNKIKLSDAKIKEVNMLEIFCKENLLNCIFLNGPIHNDIIKNSSDFVLFINEVIKNEFSYITYHTNIFSYDNHMIGDEIDHIDIKFKNEATLNYFEQIKNDLNY